jgi:hypothetical protein
MKRRHMKLVWVNGRTPRAQTFCALCSQPIGESYLRELATVHRFSYCDHICYLSHCQPTVPAGEESAMAS